VTPEAARRIGLVGLTARASGIDRDVRVDFPYGMYRYSTVASAVLDPATFMRAQKCAH
jgi:NADH:ubiquinone oxidoreductase subunit D